MVSGHQIEQAYHSAVLVLCSWSVIVLHHSTLVMLRISTLYFSSTERKLIFKIHVSCLFNCFYLCMM